MKSGTFILPSFILILTTAGLRGESGLCPIRGIGFEIGYSSSDPTITINGNTLVCPGETFTLIANGALTYTWSNGVTGHSLSLSTPSNTTISVSGTDANGFTNSASITVNLKTSAAINVNSATVCPGYPAALSASMLPSGESTFTWQPGGVIQNSITVYPFTTTAYTIRSVAAGCEIQTITTVEVKNHISPVTSFKYVSPICRYHESALPVPDRGFKENGVYICDSLEIDPVSGLIEPGTAKTGTYIVSYQTSAEGCVEAGSSSYTISIADPPPVVLSGDTRIAPGNSTRLSVSGGSQYTWTPVTGLSCLHCPDPEAAPSVSTRYCVTAAINGCETRSCMFVEVTCKTGDYSVPNVFSPNGDGENDMYCLRGWENCVTDFRVIIFNRWGEVVFESSDPNFCWDGNYRGQALSIDVYTFLIRATYSDNGAVNKKGNITLLR